MKMEDLIIVEKMHDLFSEKKDEGKKLIWILAIIGAIATIIAISVAVYKYYAAKKDADFEDDFDDDFDDDFFDDDFDDDFEEVVEEDILPEEDSEE